MESFWPKKLSQIDSQYWVNLNLNIGSIWLSISSQFESQYRVNLTLNIELIWLSISSQFDSQYRVNLTLNIESIWLKYSPITQNPGSNFSSEVTQLFRSKWLNFSFSDKLPQCSHSPEVPPLNGFVKGFGPIIRLWCQWKFPNKLCFKLSIRVGCWWAHRYPHGRNGGIIFKISKMRSFPKIISWEWKIMPDWLYN